MNSRLFGQQCCTTTPSAAGLWAVMFALLYGAGQLAGVVWPSVRPSGDTLILTALALACFANVGPPSYVPRWADGALLPRGGTVALLIERAIVRIDMLVLWSTVAVAFGLEWWTSASSRP
jgi:hypothetical protein